jgi:MOSC domain-containing protein YiiM
MQVMSVNLGKIREMAWKGRTFNTAIFKEAVLGKVQVGLPGLVGDEHANAENHGGRLKALFAYPTNTTPNFGTLCSQIRPCPMVASARM